MAKGRDRRRMMLQLWAEEHALAPHVEQPEDWPTECRLGPVGLLPTYCGDHAPGFLGLYAIINGLGLLLAETVPLRPAEERMLLDLGWKFLTMRGPVAPWHGIRANTFGRLAEALTFALSRHRSQVLRCERVTMANDASGQQRSIILERLLVSRKPVIVLLGRGHYTVVRGYTALSWLLLDATGRMWMKRSSDHSFSRQRQGGSMPLALVLSRSI